MSEFSGEERNLAIALFHTQENLDESIKLSDRWEMQEENLLRQARRLVAMGWAIYDD